MEATGTNGFTQIQDDDDGTLYSRFGTEGRAVFFFVQEDGSFESTSFGVISADELRTEVNRLIDT